MKANDLESYQRYTQHYWRYASTNDMVDEPYTFREYTQLAKEMRKARSHNPARDIAGMQRVLTAAEAKRLSKDIDIKVSEAKRYRKETYMYKGEEKKAVSQRQAAFLNAKYDKNGNLRNEGDIMTAIYRDAGTIEPEETYNEWRKKRRNLEEANRKAEKR